MFTILLAPGHIHAARLFSEGGFLWLIGGGFCGGGAKHYAKLKNNEL